MADGPDRDEKTEEATPRRREEARDKGQVAFSSEVMVVATMLAFLGALLGAGHVVSGQASDLVETHIRGLGGFVAVDLEPAAAAELLAASIRAVAPGFLSLVGPLLIVTVIAGFFQVGLHFASKAIEADISKLDPIRGAQKLVNVRSWMRTFLGLLKVLLIGTAMIGVTALFAPQSSALVDVGPGPFLQALGFVMFRAVVAGLLVLVALAVWDFFFQRMQHSKDLRMTKKEVRDESRNAEGDPLVKSRIRQVQRELASRRMMEDVPNATVVITNPTHFAVALRYDEAVGRAPVVVAKGLDEVAFRIREIATEHGVIVYEEPPLARALHRTCEIGDSVPAELFEAVARVLAYVYRVKGRAPVGA